MSELTDYEKGCLDHIMLAAKEHDPENHVGLALVRTKRKSDGKEVAFVCRVITEQGEDDKPEVRIFPIAIVLEQQDIDGYEQPST
jgi:hypothetical protein